MNPLGWLLTYIAALYIVGTTFVIVWLYKHPSDLTAVDVYESGHYTTKVEFIHAWEAKLLTWILHRSISHDGLRSYIDWTTEEDYDA